MLTQDIKPGTVYWVSTSVTRWREQGAYAGRTVKVTSISGGDVTGIVTDDEVGYGSGATRWWKKGDTVTVPSRFVIGSPEGVAAEQAANRKVKNRIGSTYERAVRAVARTFRDEFGIAGAKVHKLRWSSVSREHGEVPEGFVRVTVDIPIASLPEAAHNHPAVHA